MGKVRIDIVKRTARKLLEQYPDKFTADYATNVKVAEPLLDAQTKRFRNRIIGYVTRLKKAQDNKQKAETLTVEEASLTEEEASDNPDSPPASVNSES